MIIDYYKSEEFKQLKILVDATFDTDINEDIIDNIYTKGNHFIITASLDEKIVGCAFVEKREDYIRNKKDFFVSYVAVDPTIRNHGIGRKIFDKIREIALKNDIHSIELTSANYRTGAHKFYEKIGFAKKKTTIFIDDQF